MGEFGQKMAVALGWAIVIALCLAALVVIFALIYVIVTAL